MAEYTVVDGDHKTQTPLNVLIVEDGAEARERIGQALNTCSNGCHFCGASTEISAMFNLGIALPDVVILDMTMHDREGLHTLERMREISSVPVIALSGNEDAQARIDCLQRGADYCLPKDVPPAELMARARALVRRDTHNGKSPVPMRFAAA